MHDVARLAGVSSRTLRHYDDIELLTPSGVGAGGIRYYDDACVVRLQRILLLRQLGLSLASIARVLAEQSDEAEALRGHLHELQAEQDRIGRQITAVENTLTALREGKEIMADEALDGFDNSRYRDEVEARWGKDAYAQSDSWWKELGEAGQADFTRTVKQLNADWITVSSSGATSESDAAQAVAARHAAWLASIPGTPRERDAADAWRPTDAYLLGLGEMYVADPRFAVNYGGPLGAGFVRDALAVFVERRASQKNHAQSQC